MSVAGELTSEDMEIGLSPDFDKANNYRYSREELMALRFSGMDEQKKKWVEVYCGLGDFANEYDALLKHSDKHKETTAAHNFNFDPRKKFASRDEGSNNYADEESEYIEEDDSDDDYSSIQRPAFLVTGEPDFDSGPPQDALEYLRRVRWEAARLPKVVIAKVNKTKEQTVYMPQIPDITKCSDSLLPHKQWEDSFLSDFSELRQAFTKLDPQASATKSSITLISNHKKHILEQIFGSVASGKFDNRPTIADESCSSEASSCTEEPIGEKVNTHPQKSTKVPCLSTIFKMDYAARNAMLKRRISAIESMASLLYDDCLWLFSLCATVDYPVDADTSAHLRSLLRKCAKLRAGKTEIDDEAIMLNIIITVTGRYFGQLEK